MIECPPISAEKILYECKKCKLKFHRMKYWSDYGYRRMECTHCQGTYFVDSFKDSYFDEISDLGKKKFAGHVARLPVEDKSGLTWFERAFAKVCDPCECGGLLEFAKAETDLKCPNCKEPHSRILRTAKKYSAADLKIKWVTHNNFKKSSE